MINKNKVICQKNEIFDLKHDISILKNKLNLFNFHNQNEQNFYQNSLIHSSDDDYDKCKEVLKELNNFIKLEEKRI